MTYTNQQGEQIEISQADQQWLDDAYFSPSFFLNVEICISNVRVLTFGGECQTLDNISWRESAWPVCWII